MNRIISIVACLSFTVSALAAGAKGPGELQGLKAENERLKSALADSKRRIETLEARLAEIADALGRLKTEMARLEAAAPKPSAGATGKPARPAAAARNLSIRVAADDWGGARLVDIRKVLESAAGELWRHFPDRRLKPIVVHRSRTSPIVLFKRGPAGEYIVKLNVGGLYWCQYAYQFAHEFCHILANFSEKTSPKNKWFEESLCEMASIFALQRMAVSWKTSPPYPNWKGFAPSIQKYVDDIRRPKNHRLPENTTLAAWYRQNEASLRKDSCLRAKNRMVAMSLLPLFESGPEGWEAVGYLNLGRPDSDSFQDYLANWYCHTPQKHRKLVGRIIETFEMKVPSKLWPSESLQSMGAMPLPVFGERHVDAA